MHAPHLRLRHPPVFSSLDKYSMNCNKHPKILSSSLYTTVSFYGSKPEYNDES